MCEEKTQQQIQAMNDLVDRIQYSINEGYENGSHKSKYKLTSEQARELDVIERALELDGRSFDYQPPYLVIDSRKCEIPYI